ncbi:MAG: uracil-DNA glycosylase [Phocaeicola sp.]|nr:uracil-DNA glycosylase [Phocaeicola sp.]MDD7449367.1 uracil-DNA glycosylase [Prevotellaceae bacterium]MDY5938578.1 uracil-DNA glycosylase [Phocaeicola sp.]
MNVRIEPQWKAALCDEFGKEYFKQLTEFVRYEYATQRIFPRGKDIFRAFDLCPFDQVKVVILGQDPYHGIGQANGLCFSVNEGISFPPSLRNIFKELLSDLGRPVPLHGDLSHWASQGVLLLNATLTVREGMAGSHQGKGWETFTDAAIKALVEQKEHLVFILWGSYAQKKMPFIESDKHLVLKSAHPSPLSAHYGFFGNHHFSKANEYLVKYGQKPIEW